MKEVTFALTLIVGIFLSIICYIIAVCFAVFGVPFWYETAITGTIFLVVTYLFMMFVSAHTKD